MACGGGVEVAAGRGTAGVTGVEAGDAFACLTAGIRRV